MRFGKGLTFLFGESWAFVREVWWLVVLLPLLQVARDLIAGPFVPLHSAVLFWTMVTLFCLIAAIIPYWFIRFIALRHDVAAAISINRAAARTYAPYLATIALLQVIGLVLAEPGTRDWLRLALPLAVFAGFPLLAAWTVTAPSGSTVVGPLRSARLVLPHYFWGLGLALVVTILFEIPQFAANAAIDAILDGGSFEPWLRQVVRSAVYGLFAEFGGLLQLASLFVIAHRAGVRVSEDRSLAAVFD